MEAYLEVGTHIRKNKTFFKSINCFCETKHDSLCCACQIFTGSPKIWRRIKKNEKDILSTKQLIYEKNLNVYTHSIYLINLAKPREEFREKAFDCLKWELEFGYEIGFKGVVVHCGKSLKMNVGDALANMYYNMCDMLPFIHEKCSLLLETSAGQGTELCWKYSDLLEFYQLFTDSEKQKIKICIDTCHVFAAGHDPEKFIKNWMRDEPDSLVLVHFNDSKECCGEKKDRHEMPGKGHIGEEKMQNIKQLCLQNEIPMVYE